ncbi:alpha/beta fold hydrolase [Falsiroseomonas selenitidurans]|uniref:Alpha/beta fold hydrolase n=1 Tax=Falsiroseomonas selenitidurans TaxID=2716335 RepID=A0ABX1DZ95_9PROT|nr:alpha/beta fold hydrolase [Falsiroseomonas selenitidurans]NKC30230.1 alpha/beta fold hydrolase [Falsiroseomonas selenitidurans]
MRWLSTPEVALRYEVSGRGETTILLLHEMGGSLESWDLLVPLLTPRFRVLRHDQRGAGLSEKPAGPLSMAAAGRDAVALLDALGIDTPVVAVGMAVGGALALHLAAAHPARLRAVVATSPATGVPEAARAAVEARAALLEREGTRAIVDAGLALSWPEALRGDAARFAECRAQRLGADAAGLAATMRMLAGLDMTAELPRIACPSLILAARHDLTRPPDRVAPVAAAIPGAVFKVVESGHFMAIQTPELLAAEILGFVAG